MCLGRDKTGEDYSQVVGVAEWISSSETALEVSKRVSGMHVQGQRNAKALEDWRSYLSSSDNLESAVRGSR